MIKEVVEIALTPGTIYRRCEFNPKLDEEDYFLLKYKLNIIDPYDKWC